MNFVQEAKLSLTSEKSCFVSLPRKLQSLNITADHVFVIESVENEHKLFVSWNGMYMSGDTVEICGVFAGQIGLVHGEVVMIHQLNPNSCGNCDQVYVEPIFEDDWEILHTHHVFIESQLLRQIRVVTQGLIFPIFITEGNLQVFVRVSAILPSNYECSRLHEMTELHLTSTNEAPSANNQQQRQSSLFGGILNSVSHLFSKSNDDPQTTTHLEKVKLNHIKSSVEFKSLRVIENSSNLGDQLWNTVFVHPSFTDHHQNQENNINVAKLKVLLSPDNKSTKLATSNSDASKNVKRESIFDEKLFIETFVKLEVTESCPPSGVILCINLQRQLGLSLGSRISLQKVVETSKLNVESHMNLIPLELSSDETILYKIISHLKTSGPLILCHGSLINVDKVDYLISSSDISPFLITANGLKDVTLDPQMHESVKTSWGSSLPWKRLDKSASKWVVKQPFEVPSGYKDLYQKLLCLVSSSLSKTVSSSIQSILLHGPRGSGKSFVVQSIINHVSKSSYSPYIQVVDCKTLRGKRPEAMSKIIFKEFSKLIFYQPSLLILEDIDSLIPKSAQEESGPEQLQNHRIALLLTSFWSSFIRNMTNIKIVIISTAKSLEALNDLIIEPKGNYFFTQFIEIEAPDHEEREEILDSLIKFNSILSGWDKKDVSVQEITKTSTNGYLACDLKALVDQVVHETVNQKSEGRTESKTADLFHDVLKNFTPCSLRGVNFKVQSSRKLADVGGLREVKKILLETLLWPSKYPILYSKIPVQTNNNIILHGPSGTGKTLLAEAIANEIGINFLKVEGPELLSKYIGASELAVRDVFKKASSIKPVILFFDEFDSIAPRRGHDSTGVTDRVVNQLLTQLDGIEDIEKGVFVLAATSRIDLIDPALLRPGRFNKCLLCPIPDVNERLEILQVLSKSLVLYDNVDLEEVSRQIDGFTGADIQSILCTAQLKAFHEIFDSREVPKKEESKEELELCYYPSLGVEKSDPPPNVISEVESIFNSLKTNHVDDETEKPVEIKITMAHLKEAIDTTKPSAKSESSVAGGDQAKKGARSRKRVTLK